MMDCVSRLKIDSDTSFLKIFETVGKEASQVIGIEKVLKIE